MIDRLVNACLLPGFTGTEVPAWVVEALADDLAGVTLFPSNLDGPDAVARLASRLRAQRPDALVAIDEEGGDVTRLEYRTGSRYPGPLALGMAGDPRLTRKVAESIAADLVAAGVNYNLAPSFDVNSDPDNPVIGVRSFGSDPETVAAHASEFVRAMRAAGVATAAKHFPGHGATTIDSHQAMPAVDVDLETFRTRELAPFRAAVRAGASSLMVGHVLYPAVDPLWPATLSRTILHDIARVELGFDGVLMSTAPALVGGQGVAAQVDASIRALRAGADLLLLGPADGAQLCERIRVAAAQAVERGELDLDVLRAAGARVGAMRAAAANGMAGDGRAAGARVGAMWAAAANGTAGKSDGRAARQAAWQAARVRGEVSLAGPATVIEVRTPGNVVAGEAYWSIADRLAERGLLARAVIAGEGRPADVGVDGPMVIVVRDAYRHPWQRDLVRKLLAERPDAILVAVGMPDDAGLTDGASVCVHGTALVNTEVAADLLAGRADG